LFAKLLIQKYLLILIIFFLLPSLINAQDYQISYVLPHLSKDTLKVDLSIKGLFEDKIRKTLLSGLPLILKLDFELVDSEQDIQFTKQVQGQISYDIWEEYFTLRGFNKVEQRFQQISRLENWFGDWRGIKIMTTEKLLDKENYLIKVNSSVILLGRKQSDELDWWLQNSDQTEENLPTQDRTTGFKLNLNRLVKMFFSGEKSPEEYRAFGNSNVFNLFELYSP
jgi:hypothetical protein